MSNKMLIDASHPEETRVVVVRGNRVEEFDFESANRKQLRGNIYLAKVTRVEPSLQAAFVEYGGNRHGFLAFSEIHPDYYQIPVADRQALLEEEARAERDQEREDERAGQRRSRSVARSTPADETVSENGEAGVSADKEAQDSNGENGDEDHIEQVGGSTDAMEEVSDRRVRSTRRQYKIQEVIKRRQVLLIQVVKEERGNKGAALTTYLSLAGRYSVLMPNTARGGGISRKITNLPDRKRLKEIAQELEVPEGMGVIVRTAGAARTRAEIRRDFEYLLRLWESVRELTLQSTAPTLVYEEGSLIKRAIRDLYNKDIDEVLVAGDEGYREAKDFMRMLMPSHAKVVQPYKDVQPLFARNGVEAQLDAMFSTQVTLKSGGYIVINPTEALVSIDVNSGRSTREHNIEDTAYRTNLEAAEEVARQLRLRDLAGLIVIDFIDMEDKRNIRTVEKKLKDCLKNDRARIQVGRISAFGLMEMSRQRIRTGVLESSSVPCPHCAGSGFVRSTPSIALHILRALEEALIKTPGYDFNINTRTDVALYILNQKRIHLRDLETRFGVTVTVLANDAHLTGTDYYVLERGEAVSFIAPRGAATGIQIDAPEIIKTPAPAAIPAPAEASDADVAVSETEEDEDAQDASSDTGNEASAEQANGDGNGRKRRRRRRRRGGRGNGNETGADNQQSSQAFSDDEGDDDDASDDDVSGTEEPVGEVTDEAENAQPARGVQRIAIQTAADADGDDAASAGDVEPVSEPAEKPASRRRGSRRNQSAARNETASVVEAEAVQAAEVSASDATETPSDEVAPSQPETPVADAAATNGNDEAVAESVEPESAAQPETVEPPRPRRSGWWSRK